MKRKTVSKSTANWPDTYAEADNLASMHVSVYIAPFNSRDWKRKAARQKVNWGTRTSRQTETGIQTGTGRHASTYLVIYKELFKRHNGLEIEGSQTGRETESDRLPSATRQTGRRWGGWSLAAEVLRPFHANDEWMDEWAPVLKVDQTLPSGAWASVGVIRSINSKDVSRHQFALQRSKWSKWFRTSNG